MPRGGKTLGVQVVVTTGHRSKYPNPVEFRTGETVQVTDRRDDEFPGWVWIRTTGGNEDWAPEARLDPETSKASADYSARELNTDVGERLEVLEELCGWCWCRSAGAELGWVGCR